MKKCLIFLKICSFIFGLNLYAQTPAGLNNYRLNTVGISEGDQDETGSGIIIGKDEGKLIILTAKHVVGNKSMVKVALEGVEMPLLANVLETSEYYDLAMLTVQATNFKWQPYNYVNNLAIGDSVFILSANRNKIVIPSDGVGIIADGDEINSLPKLRGIVGGDSGSPLWTSIGLAGMVYTRSPVQAYQIGFLKKFLTDEWHVNWQLTEGTIFRPAIVKVKAPDFDDYDLPLLNVTAENECSENAGNLIDKNYTSYWSCTTKGWVTLNIKFFQIESIRKIKVLDKNQDLPRGKLEIPGQKIKISMAAILSRFMDNDANGSWFVYDLGKIIQTDNIKLTLKVKEGIKANTVEELRIHEIKIAGIKTH